MCLANTYCVKYINNYTFPWQDTVNWFRWHSWQENIRQITKYSIIWNSIPEIWKCTNTSRIHIRPRTWLRYTSVIIWVGTKCLKNSKNLVTKILAWWYVWGLQEINTWSYHDYFQWYKRYILCDYNFLLPLCINLIGIIHQFNIVRKEFVITDKIQKMSI